MYTGRVSPQAIINEYLMLGLRTMWGCDMEWLSQHYGYDLLKEKQKELGLVMKKGLLTQEGTKILLTDQGKLVADEIAKELFCESEKSVFEARSSS